MFSNNRLEMGERRSRKFWRNWTFSRIRVMQWKIDLFNTESFFCMVEVSCVWRTLEFNERKLINWISRLELKTSDFSFVWKIEGPKRDDAGKMEGNFLPMLLVECPLHVNPSGTNFPYILPFAKSPWATLNYCV